MTFTELRAIEVQPEVSLAFFPGHPEKPEIQHQLSLFPDVPVDILLFEKLEMIFHDEATYSMSKIIFRCFECLVMKACYCI